MIQWLHFSFFILCLFASFSKNRLVWKAVLDRNDVLRVRRYDKLSATAAGLLTLSGLAMLFWLAKPTDLYLDNPFFWAKMFLFGTASALIIWTKVDFRHADYLSRDWVPSMRVRAILAFDFVGLLILAALGRWIAVGQS